MSISVFCNNLEEIKMFLHNLSSNLDEDRRQFSDQESENDEDFTGQLEDGDESWQEVEEDENNNKKTSKDSGSYRDDDD